jgi:Ca-activated chloride channel family protein
LPLDLRLVLDDSGSMGSPAGEAAGPSKRALLARAAEAMIGDLRPGDHLTVTMFDDHAKHLWHGPIKGAAERQAAVASLAKLGRGGGTQIAEGLAKALHAPPLPDHVCRVVLVTDGETGGDEADCERIAFDRRGTAGFLVYGIGVGYNDAFLDRLAQANGGTFVHLGDMEGAREAFEREVAVMGEIALTGLVVELEPLSGLELARVDRIVPQVLALPVHDPRLVAADLGDVDRVRGQKLLVQLTAPALPAGRHPLVRVRASFHVPARKLLNQLLEVVVEAEFSADAARHAPDAEVLRTAQLAGAGRLYTLALAEAAGGRTDASARTLASAAGLYDHLGLAAMGDKLRTLTSGLTTRGALDEDVKRTLTTMARQAGTPLAEDP